MSKSFDSWFKEDVLITLNYLILRKWKKIKFLIFSQTDYREQIMGRIAVFERNVWGIRHRVTVANLSKFGTKDILLPFPINSWKKTHLARKCASRLQQWRLRAILRTFQNTFWRCWTMKMMLFTLRTISTNFTVGIAVPSGTTVKFAQSLVTRMSIDLDAGTNITIVINEEVKFKLNFKETWRNYTMSKRDQVQQEIIWLLEALTWLEIISLLILYLIFNILFNYF